MAISVLSGFKVGSTDPIDSRFVMTKAQMAAIADSVMPEVYITVCTEDGKLYAYKKDNEVDANTGKFRLYAGGSGGSDITVDNAITELSNNPVTSAAIYAALEGKANAVDLARVAVTGSYNDLIDTPDLTQYATTQAVNDKADESSVPNAAEYDNQAKEIVFKHDSQELFRVDASDFVTGGIVDSVEVENGNLVITFTTSTGTDSVSVPISDLFNADNYYTKDEIDAKGFVEDVKATEYDITGEITIAKTVGGTDTEVVTLAKVAGTGSFNDLKDKPSIDGVTLAQDLTANVNTGGIASGDSWQQGDSIESILRKLLVKYVAQTVTLTLDKPALVKKGLTVSNVGTTIKVVKGDDAIGSVTIKEGGNTAVSISGDVSAGGTFTKSFTSTISETTTYTATATTTTNKSVQATKTIKFINPFYYGCSNSNSISNFSGLTEDLVEKPSSYVKTFSPSDQYIVLAYDKSYGTLKANKGILDTNGFDETNGFTRSEITVDGEDFYVYISNNKKTETNFQMTFNF